MPGSGDPRVDVALWGLQLLHAMSYVLRVAASSPRMLDLQQMPASDMDPMKT